MSSREIASKSETHLHDIASSDARRTQGFPGVAREEVGELSLVLLLAARGFVALARLEVRAGAQRGDPPQLRGQSGVELRSWRKAGSRVSVALSDAERDRPRARFARGEHRHRGSVTKRKRDERDVARARRATARGRIAERIRLEHHAPRPSRPALLLSGAVRCPRPAASEARATGDRLFACGRVSPECVGWYRRKNARFFRDSCGMPLSNVCRTNHLWKKTCRGNSGSNSGSNPESTDDAKTFSMSEQTRVPRSLGCRSPTSRVSAIC